LIKRQQDLPKSILPDLLEGITTPICSLQNDDSTQETSAGGCAIARELAAFMWVIAKEVEATA